MVDSGSMHSPGTPSTGADAGLLSFLVDWHCCRVGGDLLRGKQDEVKREKTKADRKEGDEKYEDMTKWKINRIKKR